MHATRLFSGEGDPDGPPGAWRVEPDGAPPVVWEGFYVGPVALTDGEIAEAAQRLLGMPREAVAAEAERSLLPSTQDCRQCPGIVIHSATASLKNLEGDLNQLINREHSDDTASYMETRAVCLARPGDLVVGRSWPWRMSAQLNGIEAVAVPGIDYYYLSHALLRLMVDSGTRSPQIQRLVTYLREHPNVVIRVYSLDLELQIVLLYLMREAGLTRLHTDANSPDVAGYWNTKAPVYPLIGDVEGITGGSAESLLTAETEQAPMHRLGLRYDRLPGYAFSADEPFDAVRAARLLRSRYGLDTGCLKPSKGGGGLRIQPGLDLADEENLHNLVKPFAGTSETLILEAQVNYFVVDVGGHPITLAPSAHIRYGHLAEGLTLQLTVGSHWQGNIYLDQPACDSLGIAPTTYDAIRQTVDELRECLAAKGSHFVTGGIDFAVGTVGGAFGDRPFVAVQDPNLSSHGAEYLRRFVDYLAAVDGPAYAATKVIRPTPLGDLNSVLALRHPGLREGTRFQAICSVPGRWGMIAAGATSPHQAVREVLDFELDLALHKLARDG